jgi:transposase InsO family protein
MTDNRTGYRSKAHAEAVADLEIKHLRTRPYRPRTNGKAEQFIQTLQTEWAYADAARRNSPGLLVEVPHPGGGGTLGVTSP